MNKLSVCVLALNEENNIRALLGSVKDLADEIVVVIDDQTTDRTADIAREYTDKVLMKKHEDNFHKNKQYTLEQATFDWVLWMDADETIEDDLAKEIRNVLNDPQLVAYKVPRKNMMFGTWIKHTGWYPDYQVRLFRKSKTQFPCERIHEDPAVQGEIGTLNNHIIHSNYLSVSHYLHKLDKYTSLDAAHNYAQKQATAADLITNPIREFIKRFFAWEGYKDGVHGLSLSLLQAFYEAVVVIKAMENSKFNQSSEPQTLLDQVKDTGKSLIKEIEWWLYELKIRNARSALHKTILKIKRRASNY